MEQVKCPVAVFVNRQYREGSTVSFVLGGMIDLFLFSYLDKMLQNGHSVRLFLLIRMMKSSVDALTICRCVIRNKR